jgi:hypothetical protein
VASTTALAGRVGGRIALCAVLPDDRVGGVVQTGSALALLVPGVLADDHDPTVSTDHLAGVADLLDAWLDLHRFLFFSL